METGENEKSVRLLESIIEDRQQHIALAIPLAKLSVAYYRSGEWKRSEEVANESLRQDKVPPWDGMLLEL